VVPNGSSVTIGQANLNSLPPTGGFRAGNLVFSIQVTGPDGKPITTFSSPIQICFTLSAGDVAAAGGLPVVIQWFNSATGKWESQTTTSTAGPGTNTTVCTSVSHLSIYGVFFQSASPAPVAASSDSRDLGAILPFALGLAGVIALGAIWMRRPKK